MATGLNTLKELHSLQIELSEVREELKRCPLQLAVRQAEMKKRETLLAEQRSSHKQHRIDVDEKELILKSGEAKVVDLKVKLNQAKSNREYETLQSEIKQLQEKNSQLEEDILVLMTEQEELSDSIETLEQEFKTSVEEFGKFEEVVSYRTEKLTRRTALLEEKVADAEARLGPGVRDEYRRLAKARGEDALAACDDTVCQCCFTGQTPQSWNEILVGQVVFCKSCGAMLYKS